MPSAILRIFCVVRLSRGLDSCHASTRSRQHPNDFGPTCLWEPVPKHDNMESAGLAIGIIGLTGLFSAYMDVIEKFDAYRDFGVDSCSLSA